MSARGASAAVQAEWAKAANQLAHLLELRLDAADGGTLYRTDSYRTISWGGNSYLALGDFLGFSGLTESAEQRITDVTVTFSGVDQTWLSIVQLKQLLDRRLLIYKVFFNTATEAVIVDPVSIHDGRISEYSVQEEASGKCEVTLHSQDQFADFQRLSGRHTNPNDQNIWFPADRGFDLTAQNAYQRRQLIWGRPGVFTQAGDAPPAPPGYGGGWDQPGSVISGD